MWLSTAVGVSWPMLIERMNTLHRLSDWQRIEPALEHLQRLDDLTTVTSVGADPARSDAVLGALVRLAAVDGGNDTDAALLVIHLLRPALSVLRNRLVSAGVRDAGALVAGEAMIQIRSFSWQRRSRAHAANIVRDTNKALTRELTPQWDGREVLVDPQGWEQIPDQAVDALPASDERPEVELRGLLSWVERLGVANPEDLELLLEYTRYRGLGGSAHVRVAAARGVSVRTSKRHCAAALDALRSAVPDYLAA